VAESARIVAELEAKVAEQQAQLERKNKALEGFIAENEALKEELGDGKPARTHALRETAAATIERWKAQAQKR
jgi:uncharacterized coiled-coil protein SlyX